MAIGKFGVVVVGARGTIGGIKFSANLAGPYLSQWSKGSNPDTPAQSTQRTRISTFASAWRSLSQAQRDDWDDYALLPPQEKFNSLGLSYFVSGFSWFVAINQNRAATGQGQRDGAPVLVRPLAPIIQAVAFEAAPAPGIGTITYSITDPDLAARHVVWALVVNSQGIAAIPLKMPFMRIQVPDGSRIIDFSTEMTDKFGTISSNQRLLLRSVIQDVNGQRGPGDSFIQDAA